MFIPREMQCFWCNGKMKEKGITKMGSGVNYVTYWCDDCGGIAHFCIDSDNPIKSFTVTYKHEEDE